MSMNTFAGIGRMTKDPVLHHIGEKNTPKATFRLAIDTGKDETAFVGVEAWGDNAELIADRFSKGDRIGITASLRTSEWTDDLGEKKSRTFLRMDSFEFIEPRPQARGVEKTGVERSQAEAVAF